MSTAQTDLLPEIAKLESHLASATIPAELRDNIDASIVRLKLSVKTGNYNKNFEEISRYVDWVVNVPWSKTTDDVLDLNYAKKVLDENHYGLQSVKDRILEYLAVLKLQYDRKDEKLNKKIRAPILCLVGLVGTGKTTLAYSIANAMGRKLARIPFGGLGDPAFLRGQSRMLSESEPGQVIKALRTAGVRNPVILLDEIDRVVESSRSTIMGVLVELLDPEQNARFTDYYLDYPIDLSDVLFIATCNNTTNISTAVFDRLEPMQMPSYTDEEKITIGKKYVLPKTMEASGLTKTDLTIGEDVWPKIVRPLGFDAGVRTLERNIAGLCRKAARMIVEGKKGGIVITSENLKEFIQTW